MPSIDDREGAGTPLRPEAKFIGSLSEPVVVRVLPGCFRCLRSGLLNFIQVRPWSTVAWRRGEFLKPSERLWPVQPLIVLGPWNAAGCQMKTSSPRLPDQLARQDIRRTRQVGKAFAESTVGLLADHDDHRRGEGGPVKSCRRGYRRRVGAGTGCLRVRGQPT